MNKKFFLADINPTENGNFLLSFVTETTLDDLKEIFQKMQPDKSVEVIL